MRRWRRLGGQLGEASDAGPYKRRPPWPQTATCRTLSLPAHGQHWRLALEAPSASSRAKGRSTRRRVSQISSLPRRQANGRRRPSERGSPAAQGPAPLAPTAQSPTAQSPAALAPTARSPAALGPTAQSPTALAPTALSPAALGPAALSLAALADPSPQSCRRRPTREARNTAPLGPGR